MNNKKLFKDENRIKKVARYIYEFAKLNNIKYICIDSFPFDLQYLNMYYQFKDNDIVNDFVINLYDEACKDLG